MSAALAIFVKTPGLSPVKTRLATAIGREHADRFHVLAAAAVAAVARAAAARLPLTPYWAVAEALADAAPHWPGFEAVAQGGGGLGERLAGVEAALLQRHDRLLMIGADAPQIRIEDLAAALDALQGAAFVLGPSRDGGFWLYGTRAALPERDWRSVPWSSADTLARLGERLARRGRIARLRTLDDADTGDDLPRLRMALRALPAPLPEQRALLDWLQTLPDR